MSEVNRSEITEEVYWVWQCPSCKGMSDIYDDCEMEETVICDHCHCEFTVIDD